MDDFDYKVARANLAIFDNMVPGIWCGECGLMAIQKGDYLCFTCREELDA